MGLLSRSVRFGPTPSPPAAEAPPPAPPAEERPTYDVDRLGVPQFVTHTYIELAKIQDISRFRSGTGHDYSDSVESCRSMKHYFKPTRGIDASAIRIYSPVEGDVLSVTTEWAGVQIAIRPKSQPAFRVILFHVTPTVPLNTGTALQAGERIGTHIGDQTASDAAIAVDTPTGFRLVFWFEAITHEVFQTYQARGVTTRARAIITKAERDASPLSCSGETFANAGTLPNWIGLK